ncbi:MAG TPA: FecR domain-containing protein [Crenalkalicoccus sp.]|jgi:ferric-dicitrate binding protein FerR (iron transport regulator)|nr:FecR domain-containing protein [Crenalkalicoccus sp.]
MSAPRRALLLAPLLAASAARAAARPQVGDVTEVRGTALAHFEAEPPRRLAPASPVLLEDMLATDPDSRLACRLAGGLELRLGGNATLRVDQLALSGPHRRASLSSLSGPLLCSHGPVPRPVPVTLDLPWARIGVRGTRFFAGPLDEVFAVFVAEGVVEVAVPGGGRAELDAGDGVDVPRSGPPPAQLVVRRWMPPRIARALATVM